MNELKQCPFCGGKAELICTSKGYNASRMFKSFLVRCTGCQCRTITYDTYATITDMGEVIKDYDGAEKAITVWNRRAGGAND